MAMDCTHLALVVASFFVSTLSEFAFATTAFGPAIIYQICWQLLALAGISGGGLAEAVGNILIIEVPTGITQLIILRRHVMWRLAFLLCLPYGVTLPLGTMALERFGKSTWMKRSLGAVLLLVAIGQALQRLHARRRAAAGEAAAPVSRRPSLEVEPRSWSTVCAVTVASGFSGLLRGLFGVAGPPMMILLMYFPIDPVKWRAAGACFRVVVVFIQGGLLISDNDIRPQCWPTYCALMSGGLLGIAIGNLAAPFVDKELFNRGIHLFLCSGALLMLVSGMEVASAVVAALVGVAFLLVLVLPIVAAVRRKRASRTSLRAGLSPDEELRDRSCSDQQSG